MIRRRCAKRTDALIKPEYRTLCSIVLLSTMATAAYGVIDDLITAQISPAYFNLDHPSLGMPRIFHSSNAAVLGISWGLVASVPIGVGLGIWLALSAQYGSWPRISRRTVVMSIIVILLLTGLSALGVGEWSYRQALAQGQSTAVTGEICVLRVHQVSYLMGVSAAVCVCIRILIRRKQLFERTKV
ncbi:MAG: hypothetical protein ACP5O1_03215 [Phycisphaerae bacterium]